ncbi:MAG: RNA polymerase factor sigma-54, partial [Candidatus Binatia bacterium]
MALEIRQVQKLAQQLVMTPQLQQAIKLLQLSRIELQEMVTTELQENPVLEEVPAGEGETTEQSRPEIQPGASEQVEQQVLNRELSAVDKIGTLDWQEYIDTHSNSIHGSLTAEATSEDGEGPPSWENSLTKKTSLEDHLIWQLRLSKISEKEENIGLYIIGNLSDNGYLAMSLADVCAATEAT